MGASHTPEATSEFVITPGGQEGLRLYFHDQGVIEYLFIFKEIPFLTFIMLIKCHQFHQKKKKF